MPESEAAGERPKKAKDAKTTNISFLIMQLQHTYSQKTLQKSYNISNSTHIGN